MRGYDQWKTASPYDDEPDPYEEALTYLESREASNTWGRSVVFALIDQLHDEGILTDQYYEKFAKVMEES